MNDEINKLYLRVNNFCKNPGPLFLDDNKILVTDLLKSFFNEEAYLVRNQILQLIGMVRKASEIDISAYAHILHSIAFNEHEAGNVDFAEYLFRSACDLADDTMLNNNLAYVLRRKTNQNGINSYEIITLLFNGVQNKEPYSLINMGLHFSLNLSTVKDWKTADDLFSLLPDDLNGADSWWEKLGQDGDIEGYLTHFFLLRYNKIEDSILGSSRGIAYRLHKQLEGFPDYLIEEYKLKSLEEVIECLNDSEFDSMLDEYLDEMPCSREAADEILHVIDTYDILPIYIKLFTFFSTFLTDEETIRLQTDFKDKFDVPLPIGSE